MYMKQQPKRLLSLDVLRGITIAGMIMVNNPGTWGTMYAPLKHAQWDGLTPTDLVFPFFMFIMGVSTFLSLSKFNFQCSADFLKKLIKRSAIIFLIGMAIGWFSIVCYSTFDIGDTSQTMWQRFVSNVFPYERIRILGVMQRLSLSYFFASLIIVTVPMRHIVKVIAGILISYFLILFFGNGFVLSEDNIIAVVDRAVLGVNHMYKETLPDGARIPFDPEGLLSTIPCVAHVLIGFMCGKLMKDNPDINAKVEKLLLWGTIMAFGGMLLSYGCPVNKKIWSPTYVLVTCGFASQLLGILIWIIDIKGKNKWSVFFETFGVNPLFMYVMGGFLAILFGSIRFWSGDEIVSIKGFIFNAFQSFSPDVYFASFLYSVFFVAINWLIGSYLYRHKIYIKI
ncbi:MAG: acyltransferase family protein [Bacteroidales bacterium]